MSLKGLRFTFDVDGQPSETFAVVSFWLKQRLSFPFMLDVDVDVASKSFNQEANNLLEKKSPSLFGRGQRRCVISLE